MNLKETLNKLLMTEVTASPKGKPVPTTRGPRLERLAKATKNPFMSNNKRSEIISLINAKSGKLPYNQEDEVAATPGGDRQAKVGIPIAGGDEFHAGAWKLVDAPWKANAYAYDLNRNASFAADEASGLRDQRHNKNLKEYYKEILNNLLMTEVTASPKVGSTPWAKPVEPGSKRAVALGGLQAEHQRLKSAGDTAIGGNNPADYSRMKRIENTLAAKGADTKGNLNVHGHAIRTRDAALSNSYRLGTSGNPNAQVKDNDKRTPEQKQRMRNTASVGRRSEPGADD